MSIENFLNSFDKQNAELKRDKEQRESAENRRLESQKQFIKIYKDYYSEELAEKLKTIAEKLQDKFAFELVEPKDFQGNNCLTELILKSKFEHNIKRVKIEITTEGDRRLITIGGVSEAANGKKIGEFHSIFQESLTEFEKLNLEEKISEILNKSFIKK